MRKSIFTSILILCFISLSAVMAYAGRDKVIQIFKNGEVIQEFPAAEIDYIEINDLVPAPGGVDTKISAGEITITWEAVEGAAYNVYRSADNTDFTLLASGIEGNSYTDKSPLEPTNYYRVTAVIDGQESSHTPTEAVSFSGEGLQSGIYLGIHGFSKGLQTRPIGRLTDETAASYHTFINGLTANEAFTWLYYTVEKSIDLLEDTQFPEDLYNVAVVTFTDGLDIGSLDEKDKEEPGKYLTATAYRDDLHNRLTTETVQGRNISAYTVGIINDKGSSLTTFRRNMSSLATSSSNVYEVDDINNLNQIFEEIANSLSENKYVQRFVLSISGQSHGEKCRFTFDNVTSYSASKLYIEGTYNRLTKSLTDIVYEGLTSSSGSEVKGIYNEADGKYDYIFENLQADDGSLIPTDHVNHWFTDEGIWQDVDDEFFFSPDDASLEKIKRSAAIILNLDCSKSMNGEKLSKLQSAANSFVQTLADNTTDPTEVSSVSLDRTSLTLIPGATSTLTATVLPATAKLKDVDWSSSNPAVATVDENGTVTGVSSGEATVTVKTRDGNFTASCKVNVVTIPTPQNLAAVMENEQVKLSWDMSEGMDYKVYRSSDDTDYSLLSSSVTVNSYTDAAPKPGRNYYKVQAYSDDFAGELSKSVNVVYAPVPKNVGIKSTSGSVNLSWTKIAGAQYNVYRSADNSDYTAIASGLSANSYADNTPAQGENYYKITSVIESTESDFSTPSRFYFMPAPDNVTATLTDKTIVVKWAAVDGASYNLYRSTNGTTYTQIASQLTATSYTDSNPVIQDNYYVVTAVAEDNESSYSASAKAFYPFLNGHEMVDLGLPSGVKWASMNIGASNSGQGGGYFAWGETSTKNSYTQANSTTTGNTSIRFIGGDSKYDAATAKWGATWRLPTVEEFNELIEKCTWTWATVNGSNGYLVKGPNGNSIFLPAAGNMLDSTKGGSGGGYYWSSAYKNNIAAWRLNFDSTTYTVADNYKLAGLTVRAVTD
mgnify:CR=1 FL=1